ncbi:MAG: hypothetical protein ACUVWO_10510 [Thermodesulfobacteriota bacterium]
MGNKFRIFAFITFFLSWVGSPGGIVQGKEANFPIGEVFFRGAVKLEVKEKSWKNMDSSNFPVFEKRGIKTEQGTGMVTLRNGCHLEVAQNSMISLEQADRAYLLKGRVDFRIPSGREMRIRVGSLTVLKPQIQQASRATAVVAARNEDTLGSISLHPNGSVTIRNLQGSLSVLDQDRRVIATVASKESITIPATLASGRSNQMVAQAGEGKEERKRRTAGVINIIDEEWTYLGLNTFEWIAVHYGAALLGGLIYAYWPERDKDRRGEQVPICP